jgi:hypothetical protein
MPDCNRKGAWSCGGGGSSPSSELVLCVEASDSGVELWSLLRVDPPGWYPFRQTIGIHRTRPTLLKEMGVVIAA